MQRESFEALVAKAIYSLPKEFRDRLENIDVVVEDLPTPQQLSKVGLKRYTDLLGLYEGVPLTERGRGYGMVLPDKITLFQKPIEARCRFNWEVEQEIKRVLCHEIAHHFGISEERLQRIESIDET